MGRFEDITGQRFGKLEVISFSHFDKNKQSYWKCKCDCGTETIVIKGSLKAGLSTSCGCNKRIAYGLYNAKQKFLSYRYYAKKRGYSFNLSLEEFLKLTSSNCYYCGDPPKNRARSPESYGDYIYNGIDRVDNSIGYEPDNCVPCCIKCNKHKSTQPQMEFLSWIEKIYKNCVKIIK